MKTKYIWIITFLALASILFIQGMWLYNTYKLYYAEFKKTVSEQLNLSVQKETWWQIANPDTTLYKGKERKISFVFFTGDNKNDSITNNKEDFEFTNSIRNNRVIQDSLYVYIKEGLLPPFSLEKLDSIFIKETKWEKFPNTKGIYYFTITDSSGKQIDSFSPDSLALKYPFSSYKETIQLRNIAPEYITIHIPYPFLFGITIGYIVNKMFWMLIASVIAVIFVAFSLIRQIRIINKQDKTAKLRQDFTNSMIHDIKNPVTSIIMGADALKSGKIEDKPQVKAHYYSIISQEGERILRLANKVLELAHFEGQKVALSKQPVNLRDLLENLEEKYSSNAAKKVVFHFDLNAVETVYADSHYIYEAFDNLIENAVKYSKENEDADITVSSSLNGKNTQIAFKDLGIGISEKDQKIIFQKFERSMAVINSPNKISGFGLGLNFVQQVVQAHGGTVKVNSRLGSYSEFIINLPTGDCE